MSASVSRDRGSCQFYGTLCFPCELGKRSLGNGARPAHGGDFPNQLQVLQGQVQLQVKLLLQLLHVDPHYQLELGKAGMMGDLQLRGGGSEYKEGEELGAGERDPETPCRM